MSNKSNKWYKILLSTIVVIFFILMVAFNFTNKTNITPVVYSEEPNNQFFPSQENGAILDTTTNASKYLTNQVMNVWANFTFDNGTAIEDADVKFYLIGPKLESLANVANTTDTNGISTESFLIKENYYDGNYTVNVTASKGLYNDSKNITVYIQASMVQISMDTQYLIGDIIYVYANYTFINGTPINQAICGFILRNASGPLEAKSASTNSSGIADQTFGTTNYAEGIYEMYVTGTNESFSAIANQTFDIIGYNGPIIETPILTPDPPTYNQSGLVNVSIGVSPAYADITNAIVSYYNGTGWYNLTMTNSTTPDQMGFAYYNASIPPQNWNLQISYKIWANDSLGNQTWNDNEGNLYNYTVVDYWGPIIDDPTWNTPTSYNTTINVTVHITEDPLAPSNAAGIDTVMLYYYNGSSWLEEAMEQLSGTLYDAYYNLTLPALPFNTTVLLYIWANDSANNPTLNDNGGINFSYTVVDLWGPDISNVVVDNAPITYNMTSNITCRIQEPVYASGINTTIFIYHDGVSWKNLTMMRSSGDNYDSTYSVLIPELPYGTLVRYWIWVNDSIGNPNFDNNSGNYYSFVVEDFWGPTISAIIVVNPPITYNKTANVTCRIQELPDPTNPAGVNTTILIYYDGVTWNNLTMIRFSGNVYDGNYTVLIPAIPYGTLVQFWIWVNDSAGNPSFDDNSGSYYSYVVDDFWGPTISTITLENPPITYNKTANVTCRIQELTGPANSAGVNTTILIYYDGMTWNNLTMSRSSGDAYDGTYSVIIPEIAYGTTVLYWIWTNDSAGNPSFDDNSGSYYTYFVNDFWAPNITEISLNAPITYDMTAIISCWVSKPTIPTNAANVSTVILIYRFSTNWINQTMNRFSGNEYNGQYNTFISPLPYASTVQYWIWANDSAGNPSFDDNGGTYYTYTVEDFLGPTIENPTQNDTIIEYTEAVNITVQVTEPTDAAGIQTVILSYWTGLSWTNVTMIQINGTLYNAFYNATIPKQPYGTEMAYKIYAQDIAENWNLNNNNSYFFNYTVTDITAPSIDLIKPSDGTVIGGIYTFEIFDIIPLDSDVVNLTLIYCYNATPWMNHGSFINGINMTWQPGDYTFISVNVSNWIIGTNYTIKIIAQDSHELVSIPSFIYNIIISMPPNPVANLMAEVIFGAKSINLTWSASLEPDLHHYQIHRSLTDVGFIPNTANNIANTTNNYFLDTDLVDRVQYFYIVIVVDNNDLSSTFTKIVNSTPRSNINLNEVIIIHSKINIILNFPEANMTLEIFAQNTFNLSVNTITTVSSEFNFKDHVPLMNFYIDIVVDGATGIMSGSLTLLLDGDIIFSNYSSEVDRDSFAIYYWNGDSWEKLDSVYHSSNKSITATIEHLSVFGAFATIIKGGFPFWILLIIIGAVAGITVVVIAIRKKGVSTEFIIQTIKNKGHIKIEELKSEFKISISDIIDIISSETEKQQLRGFFTSKKKEFITLDKLKAELTKKLEGD